MYKPLLERLNILEPLIEATERPELMNKAKFLYDRISHPESYITLLGETGCGKSSIINGLIGTLLLPAKPYPTTAVISEIVFKQDLQEPEYYYISKNAKMKAIIEQDFHKQCITPDSNLARIRAHVCTENPLFNNMRVFDTPGYDSIIDEHEDVLRDFIPNSDFIIYAVSYVSGIQNNDYSFLSYLRELLRKDVKIILVVNFCKKSIDYETDSQIKKIKSYVSDVLRIEPQVFYINRIESNNDECHGMPLCNDLWNYIGERLNAYERKQILYNTFKEYIHDIYNECDSIIQLRYNEARLSEDNFRKIRLAEREFAEAIRVKTQDLVPSTFSRINSKLPELFAEAESRINIQISQEIQAIDKFSKDEMVAYTNSHLIPFYIKKETEEILHYIDVELIDLNERFNDYIQKEIKQFNDKIEIVFSTNVDTAFKGIAQEYVNQAINKLINNYLLKYAGSAGLRGGAANAASHNLKLLGNLFGKSFSRKTHIMTQRIAAKIAQKMTLIIDVVTELIFEIYDLCTWQKKLISKVQEGINKWKEESISTTQKDIDKLMNENYERLYEIAGFIEGNIEESNSIDIKKCKENRLLSKSIKEQLAY